MGRRRDWDKIGEVVRKIKDLGLNYKEGADRFGIDVGVLYEYSRRQKKEFSGGPSSAENDGPRRSSKASKSLPAELQELIAGYRKRNPDHGFKRIQDYLKSKHLVVVTRKQIRAVLKEHGLLEVLDSSFAGNRNRGRGPGVLRRSIQGNFIKWT